MQLQTVLPIANSLGWIHLIYWMTLISYVMEGYFIQKQQKYSNCYIKTDVLLLSLVEYYTHSLN